MEMKVIHLLATVRPGVDDGSETVGTTRLAGEMRHFHHHSSKQVTVTRLTLRQRIDVRLRNDEEVYRRFRSHIVKSQDRVVFVYLARGDLASHDLAENAVVSGVHNRFIALFARSEVDVDLGSAVYVHCLGITQIQPAFDDTVQHP